MDIAGITAGITDGPGLASRCGKRKIPPMSGGFFTSAVPDDDYQPPVIDTSVAHQARVYDYLLGGKDNFAADREVGEKIMQGYPDSVVAARTNRAFLGRAVRFLAAEAGVRQFLDIGTGIPSANNMLQGRSQGPALPCRRPPRRLAAWPGRAAALPMAGLRRAVPPGPARC
jgi:hypothetical protein